MKKNRYILVYGSLRKGDYNYDRFKDMYGEDFDYVLTMQIGGFDLYSINDDYPGIKRNEGFANPLTVDIIKVSNSCYEQIFNMEYYAGYKHYGIEVMVNSTKYDCTIYVYEGPVKAKDYIENGDWLNYKEINSEE